MRKRRSMGPKEFDWTVQLLLHLLAMHVAGVVVVVMLIAGHAFIRSVSCLPHDIHLHTCYRHDFTIKSFDNVGRKVRGLGVPVHLRVLICMSITAQDRRGNNGQILQATGAMGS